MRERKPGLIEAHEVEHVYSTRLATPIQALAGISLDVASGDHVAIVGANGSGKSTLARHFNGLLLPTKGTVHVDGIDTCAAVREPALRKKIRATVGMVFQNPDSQIVATIVREDVAFGPENLGVSRSEIHQRVTEALQWVGMAGAELRPPHMLSAGQRQRVAIAGVLAMRPRAVVFDEATAMLDPRGRRAVMEILRRLHRAGVTVIQVTHHMEEAALADRVIILYNGRIEADGSPTTVLRDPDRIKKFGLDVPPTVAIAREVARHVPNFPTDTMTVEALVDAVVERARKRNGFKALPDTSHATAVGTTSSPERDGTGGTPSRAAEPIIEIEHLTHDYMTGTPLQHRALDDVSLWVGAGEVVAILGETGSGKSTLIQHLNGLLRPQSGRVHVAGFDLSRPDTDLRTLRRRVGIVFQRPEDQLFERYVGDDVAFGPYKYGLRGEALRERVRWALNSVGLDFETFRDRPIFALSGGQRRRVALAGVLALRPDILVLDEPTAGLDPVSRDDLLATLAYLRQHEGLTIVIISHNLDEVARIADRIYVMAGGRVALHGTPRELFSHPEALERVGLEVPPACQVAHRLRAAGLPIPADSIHAHEVAGAIVNLLTVTAGVSNGARI